MTRDDLNVAMDFAIFGIFFSLRSRASRSSDEWKLEPFPWAEQRVCACLDVLLKFLSEETDLLSSDTIAVPLDVTPDCAWNVRSLGSAVVARWLEGDGHVACLVHLQGHNVVR